MSRRAILALTLLLGLVGAGAAILSLVPSAPAIAGCTSSC
jgi:hypothetical protein